MPVLDSSLLISACVRSWWVSLLSMLASMNPRNSAIVVIAAVCMSQLVLFVMVGMPIMSVC